MRGLHLRKPGNTLSHTEPMRTIEQTFQQLTALITDQTRDLALAMAELRSVAAERDKLKIERDSANWSLSRAKESLRAAEADVAETESVNSDLRGVNKRLVADLAAAMERLNHAESIIMQ